MPSSTSSTPAHSPDRERKRHSTRKPSDEEKASIKSTTKENNSIHNHRPHSHHHDQHHHHHHKHHHAEQSDNNKKHETEHNDNDKDRHESHGYTHGLKQADWHHHSKEGVDDDDGSESLESTRSQPDLSAGQASQETPASTTLDMLKKLSGCKVRRAKLCQPDFLEELGRKPAKLIELDAKLSQKLKVVVGSESIAFLKLFKSHDHPGDVPPWMKTESRKGHTNRDFLKPVVFAVKSVEGGRKVIDYYMTWRANTKARLLKDAEQRETVLDSEFRTIAKALDYEYARLSGASLNEIADTQLAPTIDKSRQSDKGMHRSQSDPLPTTERRRPPPSMKISVSEPIVPTIPESPTSANGSVISLPLLSMIRNVPMGNRVPLRVTNPDRLSMISCDNVEQPVPIQLPRINDSLDTLVEETESIENAHNTNPVSERLISQDTLVQPDADQLIGGRKKNPHLEVPNLSKKEENRGHQHQHESSSSRKKDEAGDSSTHKQKHHRSSKHGDRGKREHQHDHGEKERKEEDDDRSSCKSDKRDTSSIPRRPNLDKLTSEFVIVLVDINDLEKEPRSAWHRLWNVVSTRSVTKKNTSPAKVTPWSGPLVGSAEEPIHAHPHTYGAASDSDYESPLIQDDESDEGGPYNGEAEWMPPPGVMGSGVSMSTHTPAYPGSTHVLPPTFSIARSTYSSSPVIPGENISRSNDPSPVIPNITPPMPVNIINTSPNMYASPNLSVYGTPRPMGSPYVNAYISPRSTSEQSLPGIGPSLQHALSVSMRSSGRASTYISPVGVSSPIPLPIYPNVYVPPMSHVSVRESSGY